MGKDLTTSPVDRQNILNNPFAVAEIDKAAGLSGIRFDGKRVVLKEQVASFFGVSVRTIDGYLDRFGDELAKNGYELLRGNRLKSFKESLDTSNAPEINFRSIKRASQLAVFDVRAFLNMAMLLAESDRARLFRQTILDIVIDTIQSRSGAPTKYINQRDEDYLLSAFAGESYRKKFTDALKECVNMGNFKYALYTDKVYQSIFLEKAREYRKILNLAEKDKTRDTFYAEVLDIIAGFENGLADRLQKEKASKGQLLEPFEADKIFEAFAGESHWEPLIQRAQLKMASRDLAFRDALHERLANRIVPLPVEDFERFLGERSKELADRLEDAKGVLKRLKDR